MSTDTAFALGLLTLVGRRAPAPLRAFMLTVVIADDLLALVVIALVYSDSIDVRPLIWAAGLFAVALVLLLGLNLRHRAPYFVLGSAMWVVALDSGIEPPGGGPRVRAPGVGHARRPVGPRARRKALPRVPRAANA